MSTFRLHTTLIFSFLAAQALSLPQLDPRYPSGYDIRAPAAQSTAFTTTAILTLPTTLPNSVNVEGSFEKRLEDGVSTTKMPAPELKGLSRNFKARRGVDNDSHHTLAPTEEVETANHSLEYDYGQDTDPNTTTPSRSTKSSMSTSSSRVSNDVTENQKEAKVITKRRNAEPCDGPQDYECLGFGQGAVTANGMVQVDRGDTMILKPINSPSVNDHPKGWVEEPPATGHR